MEYKHTSINMSTPQLSSLMYWCIMLDVVITCTHTLGKRFTRKQNTRNTAWIVLGFKDKESINKFIKETGFTLSEPPEIALNSGENVEGK